MNLITLLQGTPDWFLGRAFCFSSTSFHAALSVKEAVYLNNSEIWDLHAECLNIVQLSPKSRVTVQNAAYLDVEDLPAQSNRSRVEGVNESRPPINEECTVDYWSRRNTVTQLKEKCAERGIAYDELWVKKKPFAELLVAHHQEVLEELDRMLSESEVSDNDVEGNKPAALAFNQRMMRVWFMRPFKTQTGGAIEQGPQNKRSVIRVLKKRVSQFTDGVFDISSIDELGLSAKVEHQFCTTSVDGGFYLYKRMIKG